MSIAVLDAAVIYGASRYLRNVHDEVSWPSYVGT
jgi:hypothetical protein